MYAIRNILVLYQGVTGDEAALDRAVSLARKVGGAVIVSEALDPCAAGPLSWLLPPSPRNRLAWERYLTERETHFERLVAGIGRLNVPVRCKVLGDGPVYESVIRFVAENGIDLIVVSAGDNDLAGCAAQRDLVGRLMRDSLCPVWVVTPGQAGACDRLAAAVSLPEEQDGDPESALRVLDLVGALNAIERCPVDVIHAWDFSGTARTRAHSEIAPKDLRELERRARRERLRRLEQLVAASDLDLTATEIHAIRGAAHVVIPQFVAGERVGLVVMGSRVRSRLFGLMSGTMAEEVASGVGCSVLAVGAGQGAARALAHPLA